MCGGGVCMCACVRTCFILVHFVKYVSCNCVYIIIMSVNVNGICRCM